MPEEKPSCHQHQVDPKQEVRELMAARLRKRHEDDAASLAARPRLSAPLGPAACGPMQRCLGAALALRGKSRPSTPREEAAPALTEAGQGLMRLDLGEALALVVPTPSHRNSRMEGVARLANETEAAEEEEASLGPRDEARRAPEPPCTARARLLHPKEEEGEDSVFGPMDPFMEQLAKAFEKAEAQARRGAVAGPQPA